MWDHKMTPDLNYSIKVHQKIMKRWWKRPEYRAARMAFIARHPVCDRCGRPATTPGHSPEDYRNFETYLRAVTYDKCKSLCSACNLMERKGMKPCSSCVSRGDGIIHYVPQTSIDPFFICRYCVPAEIKEAIAFQKEHRQREKNKYESEKRKKWKKDHLKVKK